MLKNKYRFLAGMSVVILLAFGLTGCLKSGSNTPAQKLTYINFVHLGVTLPSVDLYFKDTRVSSTAFGYNSGSGTYATVEPGTFGVKFKKYGGDSLVAEVPNALYDSLLAYSLVLYNDEEGIGRAAKVSDNFTNVQTTKANYRFWNYGMGVEAVDFFIGDSKVSSFRRLEDNVGNSNPYNEFTSIASGNYKLTAKVAGTDEVIATTTSNVDMPAGSVYTFYLRGKKDSTGIYVPTIGLIKNFN